MFLEFTLLTRNDNPMENAPTFTIDISGKTLTASFPDLAAKANGSVVLRYGNSVVLVTAVMGPEREGIDFFPLTVEYEEKYYAAGQILGSRFMRREGRPSEEAILSARVVDRAIRPLFDHRLRNEVQVVVTILSIDEDDPDVLGIIGTSLALATSDIPWNGPISAVRIGSNNGAGIVNPTYTEREHADYRYELLACGDGAVINMIEIGAKEVSEEEILEAMKAAQEIHRRLQAWQHDIIERIGKQKRALSFADYPDALRRLFTQSILAPGKLEAALMTNTPGSHALNACKEEWVKEAHSALPPEEARCAGALFEEEADKTLHRLVVEEGKRPDGRKHNELRPIKAYTNLIAPMTHGAGIFYRGDTHVFSALTLGGPGDAQILDTIEHHSTPKRFIHHYNFPPYSTGETGRLGGINRRAVGHGALAERALLPVIPPKEVFPYTIRLVSEVMTSNGSSSMASVCASSLALMDGGVPVARHVAGIAMGLMLWEGKHAVLTDIQGPEDHHGDMDFKVAGTRNGITAVQMDVKIAGVPLPILAEAFAQAKEARAHILDVMEAAISAPRPELSPLAPRLITITIPKDMIGLVIGPGGKTINGIKDRTGVDDITIEDDGVVYIAGKAEGAEKAKTEIEELTRVFAVGDRLEGEVVRLTDFGAFVKIGPNAEGLVHISEIAPFRIEKVEDVLAVGERVPVVVKGIDEKDRISLSIKMADPEFASRKGITPYHNHTHQPNRDQSRHDRDRYNQPRSRHA